ncbi:AraC family transcriptional activator of pobA [Mucilaginibacter sp. UYNi724]
MSDKQNTLTLIDPANGHFLFRWFTFDDNSQFNYLRRNNYYSVIWLKQGAGKLRSDFSEYEFTDNDLLAFTPYQPFMLTENKPVSGVCIEFHPDFFCIHKHDKEVSCSGVLFNNIYHPPFVNIDSNTAVILDMLLGQIKAEMENEAMAQYEILISYLKIFLITASRLKAAQQDVHGQETDTKISVLQNLKESIELNFKTKHTASDYADMLNISAKALARITKTHFNKTISNLIAERIVIEAKRELYLTNKPIKEIAYQLGYEDEYYFSRFFKTNADVSPQQYRDKVGFAKAVVNGKLMIN